MPEPPAHVTTAQLRGGPLDGIQVEISAGQTEVTMGPFLVAFGKGLDDDDPARPLAGSYRFSGALEPSDGDPAGVAVFAFVGSDS